MGAGCSWRERERGRGRERKGQCQEEWLGISLSHDSEAVSDCVEMFTVALIPSNDPSSSCAHTCTSPEFSPTV